MNNENKERKKNVVITSKQINVLFLTRKIKFLVCTSVVSKFKQINPKKFNLN